MASGGKRKTTMAKLNREAAVRDRRLRKQARKDARKLAASEPDTPPNDEFSEFEDAPATEHPSEQPAESI